MKNKILSIYLLFLLLLTVISCTVPGESGGNNNQDPNHECTTFEWVFDENVKCLETAFANYTCTECGKVSEIAEQVKQHDLVIDKKDATCSEEGHLHQYCNNCDYSYKTTYPATGKHTFVYEVQRKATKDKYGTKQAICTGCGLTKPYVLYAANGVADHGKLSVNGTDLVDEHGEKFQLIGLSTHGIQWFHRFVNFDTIDAIHNEFGINVIRISMYTAEGGYCEKDESGKEFLYNKVVEGILAATALDMYVIVDWHMVGAEDPADKNPLTYLKEAKEFFARISEQFKDYDNVIYEIMNEPNGNTTWKQCKQYAEAVIPEIRKNTDGIILVGNPKWSADLYSVMNSPLEGYENIMYTYHFYANGGNNPADVVTAYNAGIPVFISEHGGMESSGDGAIDYQKISDWYRRLDEKNISYVAWNISNSKGSASIQLPSVSDTTDFSNEALKEWGIWYKAWVRAKFGLPAQK